MKKCLKIVFVTIILIIVITVLWTIDSLRIIEHPLEQVVEIAKKVDGDNPKGYAYAYTLERDDNSFTITHYYAITRCKTIITYYIENDVVTKAYTEDHYTTKANARRYKSDLIDRKIEGNVVKGWMNMEEVNISADEWYNNLQNSMDSYAVKLN